MRRLELIGYLLFSVGLIVMLIPVGVGPTDQAVEDRVVGQPSRSLLIADQSGGLYRVDEQGSMSRALQANLTPHVYDVTRLNETSVMYAFEHDSDDCGELKPPCARTGFRIVRQGDEQLYVRDWTYPVKTALSSEVHDVEYLPERGEVLITDLELEQIRAIDLETGEVVWRWNASSFYEPHPYPREHDWLHINDVDRIAPETYLISVRNTNQLLIVHRQEGLREVINRDHNGSSDASCIRDGRSGFPSRDVICGDPSILNHQHNPHWLRNGSVLVADSDNDRIVLLNRTSNGSWEVGWSITEIGDTKLDWPRDVDRLPNGHLLITDTDNQRVVEIDGQRQLVYQSGFTGFTYEADAAGWGELPNQGAGPPEPGILGTIETGLWHVASDIGTAVLAPFASLGDLLYKSAASVTQLPYWVRPWHLLLSLSGFLTQLVGLAVFGYHIVATQSG